MSDAVSPVHTDRTSEHKSSTLIIRPEVQWEKGKRSPTDKSWKFSFLAILGLYVVISIVILSKSRPRYKYASFDDERRIVSDYYEEDVTTCCMEIDESGDAHAEWGLCPKVEGSSWSKQENRFLLSKNNDRRIDGDEGIWEAFLEAPEIVVGVVFCVAVFSVFWLILLQRVPLGMIFATEGSRVFILLFTAVFTNGVMTILSLLAALGLAALSYKRINDLKHSAKVISYSAKAFEKNPGMFVGLSGVGLVRILHSCFFLIVFIASFGIVQVVRVRKELPVVGECPMLSSNYTGSDDPYCYFDEESTSCVGNHCQSSTPESLSEPNMYESACVYDSPSYVRSLTAIQFVSWLWAVFLFDQIRIAVVGMMVGAWHFHPESKPKFGRAIQNALTTSFGTLAFAALVTSFLDRFRRHRQVRCWWLGPQCILFLPLYLVNCFCGVCIGMFTKFSVILHIFTGLSLTNSARQCWSVMSRHFVGGFITEVTSSNILATGPYVFSIAITFLTWSWIDNTFNFTTLSDYLEPEGGYAAARMIIIIFLMIIIYSYPLAGVFLVVIVNSIEQARSKARFAAGEETYQHLWVSPLGAVFVGCISMLVFNFMGGIILDTVDTMFLCFAIDQDNKNGRGNKGEEGRDNDFAEIVKTMPGYIVATPVTQIDPEQPIIPALSVEERRSDDNGPHVVEVQTANSLNGDEIVKKDPDKATMTKI